jgi:hypothetical protein
MMIYRNVPIQPGISTQTVAHVTPNNERSDPDQNPIQLSLDVSIGTVQYLISLWASLKPAIATRICQSFFGTAF